MDYQNQTSNMMQNGAPMNGAPMNGAPMNGTPMNGAPMNGTPMNGAPMNGAPMNGSTAMPENPKKNRKGLVIGICVAVVIVLLTIIAVLVYNFVFNTPKAKLDRAFKKLGTEFTNSEDSFFRELKIDEILTRAQEQPTKVAASVNVVVPGLEQAMAYDTAGIDYSSNLNLPDRKRSDQISVSVANIDLFTIHTTIIDNELYLELPEYLSDVYQISLSTIGKDYQGSVWKDMLGAELDEDFGIDAFSTDEDTSSADTPEFGDKFSKELLAVAEEHREDLKNAVSYQKGKGYIAATIDKDAVNDLVEDLGKAAADSEALNELLGEYPDSTDALSEMFDFTFKDDPEIHFYIDKKGRIASIETADEIRIDNAYLSKLGFSIEFNGDKNPVDSIYCNMNFTSTHDEKCQLSFQFDTEKTDDELYRKITMNTEYTDEYENKESETVILESTFRDADKEFTVKLSGEEDGETIFVMSADGVFTDYTPGESMNLTIGDASIEVDGEYPVKLSGSLQIKPLEEEIREPASAVKLFDMTEMDIYNAVMEFEESIENLSGLLE